MVDLFFSFDGQNYARYFDYFSLFLVNIEKPHPGATGLLKLGAISDARSFIPANKCAVDKTIKGTFMRLAKSQVGPGRRGADISGLLYNYEAYHRWALSANRKILKKCARWQICSMMVAAENTVILGYRKMKKK